MAVKPSGGIDETVAFRAGSGVGSCMAGNSASDGAEGLGGLGIDGTDGFAGSNLALSTLASDPGSALVEGGNTTAGGTREARASGNVAAGVSGGTSFLGEITISDRGRSVASEVSAGSVGAAGSTLGTTGTGSGGTVESETAFSGGGVGSIGGGAIAAATNRSGAGRAAAAGGLDST
jgi:hypothetical protein